MADFDVDGARRAGYSEAEIVDFLAPSKRFDAAQARRAGYSDAEILAHLVTGSPARDAGAAMPKDVKAMGSALQGATLGFADEISGAIGATVGQGLKLVPDAVAERVLSPGLQRARQRPFAENYAGVRDQMRGAQESFAREAPITSTALQVAGGLATGGAIAGAARQGAAAAAPGAVQAAGRAPMALRAAGAGAAFGAAGSAGTAESVGDLATEVPFGALTGAAGGAASNVLGSAVRAGASQMTARLPENVARRFGALGAEEQARRRVAEALSRDESTPGRVIARMRKLPENSVVADAAGTNTRELLDTVATAPGKTGNQWRRVARGRVADRGVVMREAADDALGTGGQRLSETVQGLIEQRSRAAAPQYQQLHRIGVQPDAELQQMVTAAEQLGAGAVARKIATADRVPYTLGDDVSAAGQSMRDLDYLKQGLDTLIAKKWDAQKGNYTPEGISLMGLRESLIRKLDSLTETAPGRSLYARARAAYAGPSALIDAAQRGRAAMTADAESLAAFSRGLAGSELDAFRVGAMEALRGKLGAQGGQTQIINAWRDPNTRERLQAIFGNERDYRRYMSHLLGQEQQRLTEATVKVGSQTAGRSVRQDDLNAATMTDLIDLGTAASGSGGGWTLLRRAKDLYGRASTPEPVRDQIGRILMQNQQNAPAEMRTLSSLVQQVQAQRDARAARAGVSGSTLLRDFLTQP